MNAKPPMRWPERLMLTVAMFAGIAGYFALIFGLPMLMGRLGFSDGAAALAVLSLVFLGLCFMLTFVGGAPRWFAPRGRISDRSTYRDLFRAVALAGEEPPPPGRMKWDARGSAVEWPTQAGTPGITPDRGFAGLSPEHQPGKQP